MNRPMKRLYDIYTGEKLNFRLNNTLRACLIDMLNMYRVLRKYIFSRDILISDFH